MFGRNYGKDKSLQFVYCQKADEIPFQQLYMWPKFSIEISKLSHHYAVNQFGSSVGKAYGLLGHTFVSPYLPVHIELVNSVPESSDKLAVARVRWDKDGRPLPHYYLNIVISDRNRDLFNILQDVMSRAAISRMPYITLEFERTAFRDASVTKSDLIELRDIAETDWTTLPSIPLKSLVFSDDIVLPSPKYYYECDNKEDFYLAEMEDFRRDTVRPLDWVK